MKANRNKIVGIAAAAALATVAIPAYAADVVYEPPAPPAPVELAPIATWAGPYGGIALGYGFSGSTEATDPAGATTDIDTDGFVGNAFAGWNWQSGNFVYGVEGDLGYNGMDGADGIYDTEGGIDGSIRARLGFAATDNVLVYATAGGAGGRHELSTGAGSDEQTLWGWTAGAGVDVKMTDQAFARLEYRDTDLGSETFTVGGTDYDVDVTNHKVLVGVGMSF